MYISRYRVWIHPKRGSDYYYTFKSLKEAVKFSKRNPRAESPLLVQGRGFKTYRYVKYGSKALGEQVIPAEKIRTAMSASRNFESSPQTAEERIKKILFG